MQRSPKSLSLQVSEDLPLASISGPAFFPTPDRQEIIHYSLQAMNRRCLAIFAVCLLAGQLSPVHGNFLDSITSGISSAANTVSNGLGTASNAVSNGIGTAVNVTSNGLSIAANATANGLNIAVNQTGNFVNTAVGGIKDAYNV